MAVRTLRIAAAVSDGAGTLQTVYTCPAGHTTILKDVRCSSAAGAITRGIVQVASGPDNAHVLDRGFAVGEIGSLACWVVLEPGDIINIYSTGAGMRVWLSGTELVGVA